MGMNPTLPSEIAMAHAGESCPPEPDSTAGLASKTLAQGWPVNGLRHPAEGQTNGWYIWAGETFSDRPDFFEPICLEHLADLRPEVLDYLALPPGWRFLISPDYKDVWFDANLLNLDGSK